MTDKTYNGWTNYATWRVNLEIFDGIDPRDMDWVGIEPYELASILREYVEDLIDSITPDGIALNYALAFVDGVNYREIAAMMLEAYADDAA